MNKIFNKYSKLSQKFVERFFTFVLILVGAFIFTSIASASEYYVSTSGLDTNTGTSASEPWAHHPWDLNATNVALAKVLAPGDIVYMKKGETWWDCQLQVTDSGASGNNIITTSSDAFGSGSLPVCSGSENTTSYNAGWTDDGANVWHRSVTTEPKIVVYNSTILLADTDTTPTLNKYYWSAGVLYVNVGADPNSTTLWRVGKRAIPGYIRADYVTLKDLAFEVGNGTFVGMVYIETQTGVVLDGLDVKYGIVNAISDENGGVSNEVKNCTLSNIKTNSGSSAAVMMKIINPTNSSYHHNTIVGGSVGINTTTGATGTNSIYSNTIHGQGGSGTTIAGMVMSAGSSGWSVYDNTIYDIGNVNDGAIFSMWILSDSNSIHNNTIYNSRLHGIYLDSADLNNVYNNTVHDVGKKTVDGSDWIYYGDNGDGYAIRTAGTSENNNIYNNNVYDNYAGAVNYTTGGAGNNKFYKNIVVNSVVNNMGIGSDGASLNPNIFYNNTIVHNTGASNNPTYRGHGFFMQNSTVGGGKGTFANNIIHSLVDGIDTHALWVTDTGGNTLNSFKIDYNVIDTTIDGAVIGNVINNSYTTGVAYKAGISTVSSKVTGLDGVQSNAEVHGVNSNPIFISSSNFALQYNSPAIDAGTDLSLTSDYLGNPIYGTPDIGAYEYQPPRDLTLATADTIDVGAGARIYDDGKFRHLGTTNGTGAHLKITPNGGSFTAYNATDARPAWLDVTDITNWTTTHKTWIETNASSPTLVTDHTIGDLETNTYYNITVTGATASNIIGINATTCSVSGSNAVCKSNSSGEISFRYDGGYSAHTFDVVKNTTISSGTTSAGTTVSSRYNNLISMGNTKAAEDLKKEFPNLFPVQTIVSTNNNIITKNFKLTRPRMFDEEVKILQTYLNSKLYGKLKVDGYFGPMTKSKVILFQKDNNLFPDGIVGPKTREVINR
jgi:parallel beta-helix repeat protein